MTREEAIKELTHELRVWESECKSIHPMKDALKMSIDALQDRPQGKWIEVEDCIGDVHYKCNQCGVDMRGEKHEFSK